MTTATTTPVLTLGEDDLSLLLTPLWEAIVALEDAVLEPDPDIGPSTPEEWRETKAELADHRALLDRVSAALGLRVPDWSLRDRARRAVVADDHRLYDYDC